VRADQGGPRERSVRALLLQSHLTTHVRTTTQTRPLNYSAKAARPRPLWGWDSVCRAAIAMPKPPLVNWMQLRRTAQSGASFR
jgi:hypothetical protein